jgi:hypothetical protein
LSVSRAMKQTGASEGNLESHARKNESRLRRNTG